MTSVSVFSTCFLVLFSFLARKANADVGIQKNFQISIIEGWYLPVKDT